MEPGERAADTLVREFREETGSEVKAGRCVLVNEGSFKQVTGKGGMRRRHELNIVFHVEHPSPAPPEIRSLEPKIAFEWVDLAAVVDLDVRPEAIKAWLAAGARAPTSGGAEWVSLIAPGRDER